MPLQFLNTGNQGQISLNRTDGYTNEKILFSKVFTGRYIVSKNLLGTQGFTVGAAVSKDMNTGNVSAAVIGKYIFPGTQSPPTTSVQFWSDWNGDIFDGWGYFYLYNPSTNTYYTPILSPINQADGVITTQNISAFGRNFTITHGYPAQGIFKYDIRVNDDLEFVFGAFGDMGSDSATQNTNLSSSYSINSEQFTLYYNRNTDGGAAERFHSYIIPYETEKNKNTRPYVQQSSGPGVNSGIREVLSFYTLPVKGGVTIYFSKTNDVKDWVINDLKLEGY